MNLPRQCGDMLAVALILSGPTYTSSSRRARELLTERVKAELESVVAGVRGNRTDEVDVSEADAKLIMIAAHKRCLEILGEPFLGSSSGVCTQ